MSDILRKVQQYRSGLLLRESFAQKELLGNYETAWRAIETEIARLVALSKDADNPASINEEIERLRALEQQVFEAVRELGQKAAEIAESGQREFVERATRHAGELTLSSTGGNSASVTGSFNTLARSALEQFIGASADGSPLKDSFDSLAQSLGLETGQSVRRAVVRGLTLGMNPVDVARYVRREAEAKGANPQRAPAVLRRLNAAVRTEMFRAYRGASLETYRANTATKGWRWISALSPTTCPICWSRHGKVFPLTKPLASHVACRCVMSPITKDDADFVTGEEQFKKLERGVQKDILGESAYEKWESREIESLDSFVGERESDKWGTTLYRRSVDDIMKERKRKMFRTDADPARMAYGAGRDSHPEEYLRRMRQIRLWGVEVTEDTRGMNYQPAPSGGRPGHLRFDRDASISALRHEYRHVWRDVQENFPGMRFWFEDLEVTWREEFWAYAEELRFAREQKDYELGRALVKLMRERKKEIYGDVGNS